MESIKCKHETCRFLKVTEGPKFFNFPQPASPTMTIFNCFSTLSSSESNILSNNQLLLYSTNIHCGSEHSVPPLQNKVSKLLHTLHHANIMNVTGGTCTALYTSHSNSIITQEFVPCEVNITREIWTITCDHRVFFVVTKLFS